MATVLLVIHLMIAASLCAVVLLQRSEGGALGIGGGGGFLTGRGQANALTRATAILAALFFLTSLALSVLTSFNQAPKSILESVTPTTSAPAAPGDLGKQIEGGQAQAPAAPAAPGLPTAPEAPRSQ